MSALTLVLLIMVLLTFIAFSTYHTLSSNKENAISAIQKQGNVILNVLLASFNIILEEKGLSVKDQIPQNIKVFLLDDLIKNMNGEKIIEYVCIVSDAGEIKYQSSLGPEVDFKNILSDMDNKIKNMSKDSLLENEPTVYELGRKIPSFFKEAQSSSDYIIIGMEMKEFEVARKADINHAIVMVSILIIIASGALFFIYIIRNYYYVNRELSDSRDYIHSVVDSMANGLISINYDGDIVACNRPAEILLGMERKMRTTLRTLDEYLDFEDTGIITTLNKGLTVRNKEIQYNNPDGKIKTILLNSTPLTDLSKNIKGAVIILNDLSEIKILEEKVRRTERFAVIGKIAAVVAHEIRNPLSSIRGFANFFSKTLPEDEKKFEYANIIVAEVDRINRVITDLLQYAKNETLNLKKTDLHDFVDQTLLLIECDINNKESIIINSIPDTFNKVNIDPDKMKQVLLNLLLNAIQVAEGKIEIKIGANIAFNSFNLWVEDNGPGIDVKEKKSVFDPFFSLREQGSGLGLSIVQKIVENHDGSITFESPVKPGLRGTKFIITLPLT